MRSHRDPQLGVWRDLNLTVEILARFQDINTDTSVSPRSAPFNHIEIKNYGASLQYLQTCSAKERPRFSKGAGTCMDFKLGLLIASGPNYGPSQTAGGVSDRPQVGRSRVHNYYRESFQHLNSDRVAFRMVPVSWRL